MRRTAGTGWSACHQARGHRRQSHVAACLLLWVVVAGLPAALAQRDLGAEYNEPSLEVVTPHLKWATALPKGPLRVLSLGQPAHQRDAIELAQRFPLRLSWLTTERFGFGYQPGNTITSVKGASEAERLARFRTLIAQECDVIVPDGQFLFEVFPDEVTYKILRKVREGAGLVIFTHYPRTGDAAPVPVTRRRAEIDRILYGKGRPLEDAAHFLSAGVPFGGLTAWSVIPDAKAFEGKMVRREYGKGRILILTDLFPATGSAKPSRFCSPNTFEGEYAEFHEREYYYAFAMKALLWAARREPDLLLERFALRDGSGREVSSLRAEGMDGARIEVAVQGSAPAGARAEWCVRGRRGEEIARRGSPLREGRAVLPLPSLGAGRYTVDAVLWQGDTTLNWGTTLLIVEATLRIAGLEAGTRSLQPGQPAQVAVTLSQAAPPGVRVRCSAVGNYERLLARDTLPFPPGKTALTWRYTHRDRIGRMLRFETALLRGGRVLDTREAEVPVRLPLAGDRFQMMMWHTATDEFLEYLQAGNLANLGFDSLLSGYLGFNPLVRKTDRAVERAARAAGRLNLGQWAYITGHHPQGQENNIRRPCLTDPAFHEAERARIHSYVKVLRDYGVIYHLGDENTLQTPGNDVCFSPTCNADLRAGLRKTYADLDSLNREWGTAFATWEEVAPLALEEARRQNQPARWVDHRLHMSRVWVDIYRKSQEWVRQLDPGALVGIDYTCADHGDFGEVEMSRTLSFAMGGGIQGEAIRSQDLPGAVKGSFEFWGFWGDRHTKAQEWRNVWDALMRGSAVCVAFAAMPGDAQSYIASDLRPFPWFRKVLAEAEVVKGGVDRLLLPLKPAAPVAILFSEAAQFAGKFHQCAWDHRGSYFALQERIWDAGANCHLLPVEDLASEGAAARYRVLFVPGCLALSDGQVAALRRYVEGGGTLVADLLPGAADEHGRLLPAGRLNDLFGLRAPAGIPATEGRQAVLTLDGKRTELDDALVGKGIAAAGAQASGGAGAEQVVMRRKVGKGCAVLLNLSAELTFSGANAAVGTALIRGLLAGAGVAFPVPGGRANFYQDGANEYLLAIDAPARVAFSRPGHLYDGRRGRTLGFGKEAVLEAGEPGGRWVSCLPYRVEGLSLAGPKAIRGGQPWVCEAAIRVQGKAVAGRHVFFAVVRGPDGRERGHYRLKVTAAAGRARIVVPLCLSDAPGAWKLDVRDVATGASARLGVTVLPGGA